MGEGLEGVEVAHRRRAGLEDGKVRAQDLHGVRDDLGLGLLVVALQGEVGLGEALEGCSLKMDAVLEDGGDAEGGDLAELERPEGRISGEGEVMRG